VNKLFLCTGKYVPAITHRIHTENQNSPAVKINLKGMAIGDGWSDPVNMLNYGDYLYNVGLLDWAQKKVFEKEEALARNYIQTGQFPEAFKVCPTQCNKINLS
jgi:vitellogenic carboxypeptidase-like protein